MLKSVRFSLLFLIFILTACGKNEFKIEFILPADLTANFRLVYYASGKNGGVLIESAAPIMDGKGAVKSFTVNPTLLYLYAGGKLPTVIYAERHDKIKVTGNDKNAALWSISGNRINEDLSLWRNAHATTLLSGTPADINEAVADFVERNTDNPVSAILLLTAYSRFENEEGFRRLWNSLGEKAEKRSWLMMTGRSDVSPTGVKPPGKLISMALRSLANGVDTVRPSDKSATILFFWSNGMDKRREFMDSISMLAKEFPDSAKRMIADICVDADSITWRSPLRSDSTKNIARFWVPAGLADLRLIDLQVTRLPFFMVVDTAGNQKYRGGDVSKAMEMFRTIATENISDSVSKKKSGTPGKTSGKG